MSLINIGNFAAFVIVIQWYTRSNKGKNIRIA